MSCEVDGYYELTGIVSWGEISYCVKYELKRKLNKQINFNSVSINRIWMRKERRSWCLCQSFFIHWMDQSDN